MNSSDSSDCSDIENPDFECDLDFGSQSVEPREVSSYDSDGTDSSESITEEQLVAYEAMAMMHPSELNLNALQQSSSISRVDSSLQTLYDVDSYMATTIKKNYTLDSAKPLAIYSHYEIPDDDANSPHVNIVLEPDLHNRTLYNESDFDEDTAQCQSMQIKSEDVIDEEDMVSEITKSISLTRVTDSAVERHENPSKRGRVDHANLDSILHHPKRKRYI